MLLAEEPVLVGQCQVHARTLHRRQRLDGPRQLPFQPTLEVEPLLELRHAKTVGLHQLKTRHRPLGQTLRGQAQTDIVHLVGGNQNGATAIGMLVGHIHLRQLRHDGAAILVGQVREKHTVVGLAPQHHRGNGSGHQQHHPHTQSHALRTVQGGQPLNPCRVGGRSVQRSFDNCGHLAFQYGRPGDSPGVESIIRCTTPPRSLDKPRI